MYNIIYNAGAGGDMVAAVIDSKDYSHVDIAFAGKLKTLRHELKQKLIENSINFEKSGKPQWAGLNILYNEFGKTDYMREIEKEYIAATFSHDFSIELQNITDPILIDDSEYKYAKWCMERCHIIAPDHHKPYSEEELQERIGRIIRLKNQGNINKIIPMKDILEGRLIEKLQQWIDTPLNTKFYEHWLNKIISPLPKVDK